MRSPGIILILALVMVSCNKSKPTFKNNNDVLSYYMGVYTGLTLKEAGFTKFDKEIFDAAVKEVSRRKDFDNIAYNKADNIISTYVMKGREKQSLITLEEGRKFLAKNKDRKGIITIKSGVQYEVIREGTGPKPSANDSLIVYFSGSTIDGKTFLTSDKYAQPNNIMQSIPGCKEVLQLMRVGSKYRAYLPTELAFGSNPLPGSILKKNMAVIFDIEIKAIVPPKLNSK